METSAIFFCSGPWFVGSDSSSVGSFQSYGFGFGEGGWLIHDQLMTLNCSLGAVKPLSRICISRSTQTSQLLDEHAGDFGQPNERLFHRSPKRDPKLASGAAARLGLSIVCVNFSKRIGPFRASTRPYFLLRVEMSKNSSWLSDFISATVCCNSSRFCWSMKAFSSPATNLVRCSTSRDIASTPLGLIFLTSGDSGKA